MDMSNYKMIYKDQVFNVICIVPILRPSSRNARLDELVKIEAICINEDGKLCIIKDRNECFSFLRR